MSDKSDANKPAIARIWRGRTSRERADEYEAYNYEVGIRPLIEQALGVQTFREDREGETEFMAISYWESRAAMSSFAGDARRGFTTSHVTPRFCSSYPRACRSSSSS